MPSIETVESSDPTQSTIRKILGQPDKTVEAPVEESLETSKDEALSPKFAALARKEKALRKLTLELKAKEDALKAKEAEYETAYIPKSKLKERFKSDPLGLMQENELSYEDLTQAILNQPNPELQKIYQELKAVKETQSQTQSKLEEQQKKAYEQAVSQIRTEAKLLIDSDASYETIKETNNQEAVVELIRETFDQTGQLLSVEEAAKEVEAYLLEEALKMANLRKVKEKLTPSEQAETPAKALPAQMKTLTNAQSASSKPLSAKERIERAKLAFRGQLQK